MSHLYKVDARFDAVVAFESLQSLGMGRFGEGLHPWLDQVSAARAWCLTEDDGQFILAVPKAREDQVIFNSHRYI